MSIRREIEVTRKGLPILLNVTYGTDLIEIGFKITDFVIPAQATATAYNQGKSAEVHKQICSIKDNTISFTPEKGFFEEGRNELQYRVVHNNRSLFSFMCKVNCEKSYADDDAKEVESQPTLIEQVLTELGEIKENGGGATPEQIAQIEKNKQDITKISETIDEMSKGMDLSTLTMTVIPVENGNRLTLSDGTTTKSVDIPSVSLTNEQISSIVNTWLDEHPEATTIIADGSIGYLKLDDALKGYFDNIRKIDLTSYLFNDTKTGHYRYVNPDTLIGRYSTNASFTSIGMRVLYLEKGDYVITNADTLYDNNTGIIAINNYITKDGFRGALLSSYTNNGEENAIVLAWGRETYDGLWRKIEVTESNWYVLSYKNDVDYEVQMYVYHPSEPLFTEPNLFEEINPKITDGYVDIGWELQQFGENKIASVNGNTGTYQRKCTELLTFLDMEGYSLVVDGINLQTEDARAYAVYYTDETETSVENGLYFPFLKNNRYYTIPLSKDTVYLRVIFSYMACTPYVRLRIVPNEYLFEHNMVYSKKLYGKKILGFGDSYVYGHNLGQNKVWYSLLALYNCGKFVNCGHNGAGLCRSNAVSSLLTLLSELDEEADIYFMTCGRNDSSMNVPIGEPSDTFNPETDMENSSTTNTKASFMGGLNYMYNYIIENHPNSKFVAVTPWSFTPLASVTSGLDSYDYIEAIKRISQKWGIPCYNASQDSGIHVQSEAFRTLYFLSSTDQSHLNKEGHKLMYENSLPWIEAHL